VSRREQTLRKKSWRAHKSGTDELEALCMTLLYSRPKM
jgi:hypothetical protein